jgi:hypothetical protein
MHSIKTHCDFIRLRARGYSFTKVAKQLEISLSTARTWDDQHRAEIEKVRAHFVESLKQELLPDCAAQLASLTRALKRINEELDKRDFKDQPTGVLVRCQNMILSRIDKLCANPLLPLVPWEPNAKPIENQLISNTNPQEGTLHETPQLNGKTTENQHLSNTYPQAVGSSLRDDLGAAESDAVGGGVGVDHGEGPPRDMSTSSASPLAETDSPNPPSAAAPEPNGKPTQNQHISNTGPEGVGSSLRDDLGGDSGKAASDQFARMKSVLSPTPNVIEIAKRIARGERPSHAEILEKIPALQGIY